MQFVDEGGKICYIVFKAINRGVYIAERIRYGYGEKSSKKNTGVN